MFMPGQFLSGAAAADEFRVNGVSTIKVVCVKMIH